MLLSGVSIGEYFNGKQHKWSKLITITGCVLVLYGGIKSIVDVKKGNDFLDAKEAADEAAINAKYNQK